MKQEPDDIRQRVANLIMGTNGETYGPKSKVNTPQPSLWDYKPTGNALQSALRGRGWVRARELCPVMGMDDRAIRAEAEASAGEVVSGNRGYCLITECSVEDLTHAANRLISQGKKMIRRGIRQLHAAHQKL